LKPHGKCEARQALQIDRNKNLRGGHANRLGAKERFLVSQIFWRESFVDDFLKIKDLPTLAEFFWMQNSWENHHFLSDKKRVELAKFSRFFLLRGNHPKQVINTSTIGGEAGAR